MRITYGIILLLVSFTVVLGQDPQIPQLKKRVTDLTGTLTEVQLATLEEKLSAFDRSTSTQIVVLILPTLGGESIEDFSLRVAETNRIGRKGKDNGVLLLVALEEKQIRIEVGYGLEGVLPDALAGNIIRNGIALNFSKGDFYAGIDAGISAIMLATRDEYNTDSRDNRFLAFLTALLVFGFILFLLMFSVFGRRRRYGGSRFHAPTLGGTMTWGDG
ncbi:MAG: TPM domain-containing protein, partial [Ignavibacteriae bacterium]|nr:TPM domain-containing protein [Ignavibacteriota bacterium]